MLVVTLFGILLVETVHIPNIMSAVEGKLAQAVVDQMASLEHETSYSLSAADSLNIQVT
jgi:hypothetical protein